MKRATMPDRRGYYGEFGGKYVPETLMAALDEFETAYKKLRRDREFRAELDDVLRDFVGRPTALTEAKRFAELCGGMRLFLKREDLNHTGAHKINNAIGQALIAKRMGKKRIIAETGAGQHGVATATACSLLGLDCVVYMGEVDMARQELNVFRMRLLGAEVVPVASGSRTLKDAINEAIRDWVTNVRTTHYIIGSVLGPHPYPLVVRDFQSVIGREALGQLKKRTGALPDVAIACVGGGSNAIGLFHKMLKHESIRFIGVEAGGRGRNLGEHAARFSGGALGVLHGTRSMVLQDEFGQIAETHSISAGLDYPSIGPEHAYLQQIGRVEYYDCSDDLALEAFHKLSECEGIIPALESSHALGWLLRNGASIGREKIVIVNLSGRGDKDVPQIAALEGKCERCHPEPPEDGRRTPQVLASFEYRRPTGLPAGGPSTVLRRSGFASAAAAAQDDSMNRTAKLFRRLKAEHRCGLIAYVTCGDGPTIEIIRALEDAGTDAIELGVPFSDPIADGPVIQAAAQRALQNGTTISDIFTIARAIREQSEIPLIAFSYLNPVLRYGIERFADDTKNAGIDSVLLTDLPAEAAAEVKPAFKSRGLGSIFLLAPTSSNARIAAVNRVSDDFVYYVSTTGVTGARSELDPALLTRLDEVRTQVTRPLAVGFGISKHEHYEALKDRCDAIVVGSAIVRAVGEGNAGAAERAASVVRAILHSHK